MAQASSPETARSQMTDQLIAFDLLNNARSGVRAYAAALTVSTTPAIRNILKKQLDQAISFQEQVGSYVAERGWYNVYDAAAQLKMDADMTQNTLNLLR